MIPDELDPLEACQEAYSPENSSLRQMWHDLGSLPAPEPSAAMRARFYQKLNASLRPERKPMAWWKRSWVWQTCAAAVIFTVGLSVGRFAQTTKPTPQNDVAQLRNQVEGLRETVALSLLEKQSASSRLQGVEQTSQLNQPDTELISALVVTLNQDQNINVRLAALDALEKFTSDGNVRKALEQSIPKQQSPLVQIALIDSLVHAHDRSATDEFKELSGNHAVNAVVRQRAQWAVDKLSLN